MIPNPFKTQNNGKKMSTKEMVQILREKNISPKDFSNLVSNYQATLKSFGLNPTWAECVIAVIEGANNA